MLNNYQKIFTLNDGNNINIRYISKSDFDQMLIYVNNLSKENTFVLLSGEKISSSAEREYFKTIFKEIENKERLQIVAVLGQEIVGNCSIKRFKLRQSHVGEVAISISKNFRELGLGKTLLNEIIKLAKNLELKILVLDCMENNNRAIHLYEKLGFIKVGIIPGVNKYNDKYVGLVKFYLPLESMNN